MTNGAGQSRNTKKRFRWELVMHILALDVGTSAVKAAVLSVETGEPCGIIARTNYSLDAPTPDAAEVGAERLWEAIARTSREATASSVAIPKAVGLSTLMPALVLLDERDQPLAPIWTHLDRRARPAAREVQDEVGEEFLASVGNRPLPGGISAVCFRELLKMHPELRSRIRSYLHVNGWLGLRLTGEKAFDRSNASFTGIFNTFGDHQWSKRWCEYFHVDPAWLPEVYCGSHTLGNLREAAAKDLGVPAGIPVKLGTADTSCAMLAAGMKCGDLLHVVGTTQVLASVCPSPVPSPKRLTRFFGIGMDFVHVTHNPVGGVALEWIHKLCFCEQSNHFFYDQTVPMALHRSTKVTLDPPFLGGDRLEIEGKLAGFRNLELSTERMDLLTAVLHAMLEKHREALANLGMGEKFDRVFLTGGGAEIVEKLVPEYRGKTIHRVEEGSLRGVVHLFRQMKA